MNSTLRKFIETYETEIELVELRKRAELHAGLTKVDYFGKKLDRKSCSPFSCV